MKERCNHEQNKKQENDLQEETTTSGGVKKEYDLAHTFNFDRDEDIQGIQPFRIRIMIREKGEGG